MKLTRSSLTNIWLLGLFLALVVSPISVKAAPPAMASPSGLSMLELKVTGDEFIMLHNNTGSTISDLSSYWINAYNNVSPLALGVSNSSQQLPAIALQVGQTLLLSSDPMSTCGASVAGKLSLSLSDSGGFIQLSRNSLNSVGGITQTPGDLVSWSSSANGIIQNLPSNTKSPRAVYYRYFNGNSFIWQQADLDMTNSCQLNIVVAGGPGSSSAVTPLTLATTSPPATILGIESEDDEASAVLPTADIGLVAPQISEILPNPIGTGNDNTDEFIELYNPNSKPYDLTGFTLQTGLTTAHNYEFPKGTLIEPGSFKAYYAADTKLTLSNTTSQAALLDPFGNTLSVTDVYTNAKDGVGWALAKESWQWTTELTPAAANVIKVPVSKKSSTKKSAKSKVGKQAVKGASIKKSANTSSNGFEEEENPSIVHTWVLALIALLALLYGAYEYRRDLANRLYRLRAKFGSRRTPREVIEG